MQVLSFNRSVFKLIFVLALAFLLATSTVEAGYLYVFNQGNGTQNKLYGFRVNEATGSLTLIPGFPITTGNGIGRP